MMRFRKRMSTLVIAVTGSCLGVAIACGTQTETIEVVKEVVTQVEVPVETIKEIIVEVPVEKIVERQVEKVVTRIVEKPVEVIREVPVERVVTEVVEIIIEKPVEKIVEKIIREKAPPPQTKIVIATPTQSAAAGIARPQPGSVLRVAINDVGSPNFLSPRAVHPNDNRNHWLSIFETLLIEEGTQGGLVNVSVRDWELDGLTFRAHLHPRVEFHKGWGPATAQDWAYSWERTQDLGAVNSAAASIRNAWASWKAVDNYTFEATLKRPDVNFRRALIFGTYLHSKKALLEKGDDWADKNAIGTGPYELTEIVTDDHITLTAVNGHYRETPWFETVLVLEVPDPNTMIAQLKTGEIDIMPIGVPQLDQVSNEPGVTVLSLPSIGRGGTTIFYGGQYYVSPGSASWAPTEYAGHLETVTSKSGDALAIKRDLAKALERPWIGPYLTDATENAKAILVRKAMTHAVDKHLVNDTILKGTGCVGHVYRVDECLPNWDKKLNVDYDVARAKELLAEAGFGNGFEFPVWIPENGATFVEVSEAMVQFWKEIGLTPKLQKTAYTARRPLIISRQMDEVWFMSHGTIATPFGPSFQWGELNGRGVWGQNIEYDEMGTLTDRMAVAVGDTQLQWAIQRDYWDFHQTNQITGGGVFFNDLWVHGPAVANWDAQYDAGDFPVQLERAIPSK